jgi:hypothetical protein
LLFHINQSILEESRLSTPKPGFLGRLLCILSGEVSADTLEAYRRASLAVHELLTSAEQARLTARADGLTPWTLPKATQAHLVCAWNAFVLQTLGNAFLDADYKNSPATVGFVPPITADQILRFYTPVEGWLTRAQQASANPNFVLDLGVPSDLPAWSEVEPCPNSHLSGMLAAMRAVRDHAQLALTEIEQARELTPEREAQRDRIREVFAIAQSKARYAEEMHRAEPTRDVHERVEEHVKTAIEGFYTFGQLAAMPSQAIQHPAAIQHASTKAPIVSIPIQALPNTPNFDVWCLTDAKARQNYRYDREAKSAVETLWKLDPDPALTLRIKAEIDAAYTRGDITYAVGKNQKPLGYFFCCPWGTVYSVVRPVTIGGVRLTTLQQFVFDVTAEGTNLGVPFRRQVKLGNFSPTDKFEYGDPNEEPDH